MRPCVRFIPRLHDEVCLVFCSINTWLKSLFHRPTFTHVWGPRRQTSSRCWTALDPTPRRRRWRPSRKLPLPSSSSSSSFYTSKVCTDPKHSCKKNKIRTKAWANSLVAMILWSKRSFSQILFNCMYTSSQCFQPSHCLLRSPDLKWRPAVMFTSLWYPESVLRYTVSAFSKIIFLLSLWVVCSSVSLCVFEVCGRVFAPTVFAVFEVSQEGIFTALCFVKTFK